MVSNRNLAPISVGAEHYQVSTKTIRRMIARGDLHGYRLPGSRLLRIDLNEFEQAVRPVPSAGDAA